MNNPYNNTNSNKKRRITSQSSGSSSYYFQSHNNQTTAKSECYAVVQGRQDGIYFSREEMMTQKQGHPLCMIRSFKSINEAKYIHGSYGKGTWTFYGGHDPEDYQHFVGEQPTDLNLFPNSPGFRLILNNILFPAAKKKKQKT